MNSTRIGSSVVIYLYEKQKGICFYCPNKIFKDGKIDVTVDHKNPISRGGNKKDNVCLACRECNELKGSLTEKEFKIAMDLLNQGKIDRNKIISYGQYLLAKARFESNKV